MSCLSIFLPYVTVIWVIWFGDYLKFLVLSRQKLLDFIFDFEPCQWLLIVSLLVHFSLQKVKWLSWTKPRPTWWLSAGPCTSPSSPGNDLMYGQSNVKLYVSLIDLRFVAAWTSRSVRTSSWRCSSNQSTWWVQTGLDGKGWRDPADIRFSAVRSPRFWVRGYCTKWRI